MKLAEFPPRNITRPLIIFLSATGCSSTVSDASGRFARNSLLRAKSRKQFPARAKYFPARLRREFTCKHLNSQTFSRRILVKSSRFHEIPCFFPCHREFCRQGTVN